MDIYIEDAIFDTTAINFVILLLTLFSLRQKIFILKCLISAIIGCLFSITLTFLQLNFYINLIIKLLCGLIMCIIVINNFNFKTLSLFFVVFLSFTFLIGGFCFFIIYLLGGEIYSLDSNSYNLPISLGFLSLLIGIYVWFLINVIKIFYKKQKISSFYYNLNIRINNKILKLKAYLDSGNLLQDEKTGLPVLIINFKTLSKIFKDKINIIDFLNGNLHHKINGRYISAGSINGNKKMFVFNADDIKLNDGQAKTLHMLIGISNSNLSRDNSFDALLSPLAI